MLRGMGLRGDRAGREDGHVAVRARHVLEYAGHPNSDTCSDPVDWLSATLIMRIGAFCQQVFVRKTRFACTT
jgi:hypothetical protein